jgi:SpoVK/Ycf46/Vps4 family AAA+-type ATPase
MKNKGLENFEEGRYEKEYLIEQDKCKVVVEDALYAEYKGRRELLDKTIVDEMCKDIAGSILKHVSKYNSIPSEIVIRHNSLLLDDKSEKESIDVRKSRIKLLDVALPEVVRKQINVTLSAVKNRHRLSEEWGLSGHGLEGRAVILNFFGPPGTGKSMTAEGIAEYLGKQVLQVNYSELESKYVGETPKNIKRVFKDAKEADAVIIFDEADSFLSKRLTNITQAADYGVNITRSVMLIELEQFDGVVVFTTNLIGNYDTAFMRRIFASIEFTLPDLDAREKIWKLHLGDKLPLAEGITATTLTQKYEGISGADIKDIVFYAALMAMESEKDSVDIEDFDKAYGYVMKKYKNEEE